MKLDELCRGMWHRGSAAQKWAFFCCIITGYLVHLYAFTNQIPNSDGLSRVYDLQQMTVSGRWFLHYATSLNGFTQMPAVIGFLSLVLLGLAAAFAADILSPLVPVPSIEVITMLFLYILALVPNCASDR